MAIDATTARRENWKRLIEEYQNLNQRLIEAPAKDRDALERAIAAQEEELLDTPAPSFGAVITKLELLWSEQMDGLDVESEAKRLVIEDLGDLIGEAHQLLGEAA